MHTDLDGRGEGYGKYAGLSIIETQAIFDKCISEPSMRSISAVLRITREQLDARGNLGVYPVFAWITGFLCVASGFVRLFGPKAIQELATKAVLGTACVFALLLFTTIPTFKTRKRNLTQEAAIRDAAVGAIAEILKSKPTLKPLTFEQEFTVKLLLRKSPSSEALKALLDA